MPCKFSMIFMEYLRILGTENTTGGQSPGHEGPGRAPSPWARPLPHGPMVAPLHLFLHPHTPSSFQKNPHLAQARALAHFTVIFDLLAQSSIHKTALGDCCLVCDSSNDPISFCSSASFIVNFCCLGDPVLELACQIYEVPSNLMHDIGSRHLWE